MRSVVRVLAVVVGTVTLAGAGCESNNKGKLEGTKWKGMIAAVPGSSMTLDFYADGRLALGIYAPGVNKTISGRWSLSMGDHVEMTNLSEPLAGRTSHTEKIVVTGDTLVMTDSDGQSVTFSRVGGGAAPANGGGER